MKRSHLLVLPALALAVVALIGAAPAAGAMSLTDPVGDSGAAADITSVALSDDAATGLATLVVTATNLPVNGFVDIWIDTDKNRSTGSLSGSEYYLEAWKSSDDAGWDMEQWSGKDWQEAPESSTERFNRSGDVYTWTFSKADIGDVTGFAFSAASYLFDDSNNLVAIDLAPDAGDWTFDFAKAAVIAPAIGKPFAVPASPAAGKLLSVSFPIVRADTGGKLTGGTIVAKTTIAGKAVPRVVSLANGSANVAIQIPKTAKGKTLLVRVTVTVAGKSATRIVSYTIRK
jgi:hypothetical protein